VILSRGKVIRFQSFNACQELPVRVYWATTQDFKYSLDCHPEVELQLIQKGVGEYRINGARYSFRRNTLLIVRPKQVHKCLPKPHCRIEKVCLVFSWKLVEHGWPLSFVDSLPRLLQLSEAAATRVIMRLRNISDEIDKKDAYWGSAISGELVNLIILLHRNRRQQVQPSVCHPVVQEVIQFLDEHFKGPLSILELAKRFGLSPSRLAHVFKRDMKCGIKRYALERQMAEAKMLLEREQCPQARLVAELVGFHDYRLFHRHFKRVIGCTPSEHRRFQTRTSRSSVGVGD